MDNLIESLSLAIDAKLKHKDAVEKCPAYDVDYFTCLEAGEMDRCAKAFKEELKEFILEVIREEDAENKKAKEW